MDQPYIYLRSRHRIFFHDYASVIFFASNLYPQDPNAIRAGILHIQVDILCTANPSYKQYLENLAKFSSKKRAKRTKRRKKTHRSVEGTELDRLIDDLHKLENLRQLLNNWFYI